MRSNLISISISIHALREEGDVMGWMPLPPKEISIHALREEGDRCCDRRTLPRC